MIDVLNSCLDNSTPSHVPPPSSHTQLTGPIVIPTSGPTATGAQAPGAPPTRPRGIGWSLHRRLLAYRFGGGGLGSGIGFLVATLAAAARRRRHPAEAGDVPPEPPQRGRGSPAGGRGQSQHRVERVCICEVPDCGRKVRSGLILINASTRHIARQRTDSSLANLTLSNPVRP